MRIRKDENAGFQQVPAHGAEHPIFTGVTPVGLMSGDSPRFPSAPGGHEALKGDLTSMGLKFEDTQGHYGAPERSLIVHGPTREQMFALGKKYGQEAVIHSQGGQHEFLYSNGPNEGKSHPGTGTHDYWNEGEELPEDAYTKIPGQGAFRLHFDFHKLDHKPLNVQPEVQPQPATGAGMHKAIGGIVYKHLSKLAKAYEAVPGDPTDLPETQMSKAEALHLLYKKLKGLDRG